MLQDIWLPAYNESDVKILDTKTIFSNKYAKFIQFQLSLKTFAGTWSSNVNRYFLNKPHAAAILLFNPKEDCVVLIEQFRIGALHTNHSPWILEPVAGIIENSDTPENTARREAKEESGCDVIDILPICTYLASPGTTNEETFLYCGKINHCKLGIFGLDHEDEDIKVHKFSADNAFNMVRNGKIICAQAIIALQWLEINYKLVKQKWI